MKNKKQKPNKHSSGGGEQLYNFLNKNIKEFNPYILSILSIIFLVLVGLISYKVNTTYAVFTDTIMGTKTIEITVKADTLDKSGANKPVLDNAMIPVYYDEKAETWKKADETNKNKKYQWYDYNNKMWANSATVSSANRSTYQSASVGTTIPMDDILTMQVWIPRYKYKLWNYNADGTKTSEPQEIEITFEDGTDKTGEITCTDTISGTDGAASETCKIGSTTCTDSTCNNKYYTHPAFTFGDEEIKGFWIGKFELTGTISNITTKPNLSSIRNQSVSSFETNIMNMKNSGNRYGLSTNTDTHMIKNIEWGAVAYLSHSKYGTCTSGSCTEVGINNNSNYMTGCGANAGSSSSTTCNSYNTSKGMLASTTGNIYGVYDMSGCSWEYTMSNMIWTDGLTMVSGNSTTDNSGYTGILYNNGKYGSYTGISYPSVKYYDRYSYGQYLSRIRSKLGDCVKEMVNNTSNNYGWYSDYSYLTNENNSWSSLGGAYDASSDAGIFAASHYRGSKNDNRSTRLIII